MPYELRALEVALSAALGVLTEEISALEEWGYGAVDDLLRTVDREGLEAVRRLKNAVDKLQGKVQRIVTELGDLLADDEDMCDLYLRRRAETQGLPPLPQPWEVSNLSGESDSGYEDDDEEESDDAGRKRRQRRWQQRRGVARLGHNPIYGRKYHHSRKTSVNPQEERKKRDELWKRESAVADIPRNESERSWASSAASESFDDASVASDLAEKALEREEEALLARQTSQSLDNTINKVHPHLIEEAEDLLETMFERADMLLRRLTLLDERTNDTEDLLELELDQKRNQLVGLNLLVSSVSMSFGFAAAIGGIFGMVSKNKFMFFLVRFFIFIFCVLMFD